MRGAEEVYARGPIRSLLSILVFALAVLGASPANAQPAGLSNPVLSGEGNYRWFGLKIYDARLWLSERGFQPGQAPLALELRYARNLEGARIAEASRDEMRKLGRGSAAQQSAWLEAMTRLFPNVQDGTRLTGLWLPGEGARFFLNDQNLGTINDPQFAEAFFAIWLDPRTSAPDLRTALLQKSAEKPAEKSVTP